MQALTRVSARLARTLARARLHVYMVDECRTSKMCHRYVQTGTHRRAWRGPLALVTPRLSFTVHCLPWVRG